MKKERKEYEQKYLSRYKQPKSGVKKSTSWTQHDVALGRLTLSPHFNAKRKTKQDEIKNTQKYLSTEISKNERNTSRNIFHGINNQRQRKMLVLIYTNRKYQNQKRSKKRTKGIRAEISFTV